MNAMKRLMREETEEEVRAAKARAWHGSARYLWVIYHDNGRTDKTAADWSHWARLYQLHSETEHELLQEYKASGAVVLDPDEDGLPAWAQWREKRTQGAGKPTPRRQANDTAELPHAMIDVGRQGVRLRIRDPIALTISESVRRHGRSAALARSTPIK